MKKSRAFLNDDQASALLLGTWGRWGVRDRQILVFLLNTGLKIREFVQLDVEDVYTGKRVRNMLLVSRGRGATHRRVPLSREAREAVAVILEFNRRHGFSPGANEPFIVSRQRNRGDGSYRITARQVQRILKTLREDAALEFKTTPQTLRHTYAQSMFRKGADLKRVQELLGHRSVKTTRFLYGDFLESQS